MVLDIERDEYPCRLYLASEIIKVDFDFPVAFRPALNRETKWFPTVRCHLKEECSKVGLVLPGR